MSPYCFGVEPFHQKEVAGGWAKTMTALRRETGRECNSRRSKAKQTLARDDFVPCSILS